MSPDFQLLHNPSKMHFFLTYIWFAHRLVRDVCGSNLNQSKVYKISLESLLHRVQSCGQSEFTSYRSHCPLYLFRLLNPINNQSDRQSEPSVPSELIRSIQRLVVLLEVWPPILLSSTGWLSNYSVSFHAGTSVFLCSLWFSAIKALFLLEKYFDIWHI